MGKLVIYCVAILFAVMILLFSCTYQVRFNEAGIITTFGRAGDDAQVTEPGLHFKWPYPIQSIEKFDTRTRVLETQIESVMTKDNQLIVVQLFLTWKIDDILQYYVRARTDSDARTHLTDRLRSNLGVFSHYEFSELLSQSQEGDRLGDAEQQMLDLLSANDDDNVGVGSYGIKPLSVGIVRLILPTETSSAVLDRMKETRNRLASDTRTSGEAEASRIVTKAQTEAEMIRSFAKRRAAEIKAVGEKQAARFIQEQADLDAKFAIFLQKLEGIETMVREGTTYIFPSAAPFELLTEPPSVNGDSDNDN